MNFPKLPRFAWPAPRQKETPTQGAPLAWCYLLTAVGVCALIGSTWMLLVFVAGSVGHIDWAFSYRATEQGVQESAWHYEASIHLLIGIGLFLFCLAIAMFNATWLEARKHLRDLTRIVVTGIGVAVALFMISGAIVVQQRGTDARARDEIVTAQTAKAGAGSIAAQIAAIDQRLAAMRDKRTNNEYAAAAANVGVAAYDEGYLSAAALARTPAERRDIVRRARGAAIAADALENEKRGLVGQLGAATVETVEAEAVAVKADGFMAGPVAFLEDLRKPVTAVLGELLALTAFSFALAAWASRREAEPIEPALPMMIEDFTDEPAPDPQPMDAPVKREVLYDDQGNRIVRRRATFAKVGVRRSGKKGDDTLYEAAAQTVASDPRVAPVSQMEWPGGPVEMDDAQLVQEATVNGAVEPQRYDQRSDPTDDAGRTRDIRPGDAGNDDGARSDVNDPEQDRASPEAPRELPPAEFDRLVAEGQIAEDGTPLPQDDKDVIEQSDAAPRWPALAAPAKEMESAK